MTEISLAEADRKRWGLDEWVSWSVDAITVADLTELAGRFGFSPYEWPAPFFGEVPFEQAGSPDAQRVPPVWQLQCALWQVLRQNGVKASWDEAGEASPRCRSRAESVESPGKAPSEPSTTSRSKRSGQA